MPEWRIDQDEYLKRLSFSKKDFKDCLKLPTIKNITQILPLRDIKTIESLIPISFEMLCYLIRRIKTLDGRLPFKDVKMKMVKIDPHQLKIGQKFAYRENYQKLLEEVPGIFNRVLVNTGGLGDLGAFFVFGMDQNNSYSLACYIPPIIEKHGSDLVVMDGIHRNYIAKQTGIALNAIILENVSLPFPCSAKEWSELQVISLTTKPKDINDRYFDLQKGLFRDLKYLGIDG